MAFLVSAFSEYKTIYRCLYTNFMQALSQVESEFGTQEALNSRREIAPSACRESDATFMTSFCHRPMR